MDASDCHYYAEISETLGIGIADDFPVNQKFIGLKDIVKSLSAERKYYLHPNPDGLKDYSQKPYSGLLQDCKEHLNAYRQKIINVPTVLALVHPFYAFLSHWEKFSNSNRTEKAMKYLDVLVMSLEYLRKKDNVKVVLIESVEHYAALSSMLIEKGIVHDVFFTFFDEGVLLDPRNYNPLKKSEKVYAGGSYTSACLKANIQEMYKIVPYHKIILVPELTLAKPVKAPVESSKEVSISLRNVEGIKDDKDWHDGLEDLLTNVGGVIALDSLFSEIDLQLCHKSNTLPSF